MQQLQHHHHEVEEVVAKEGGVEIQRINHRAVHDPARKSHSCHGQNQHPTPRETPPALPQFPPFPSGAHQKGRMTRRVMMKTAAKTMKMLLQVFLHPA